MVTKSFFCSSAVQNERDRISSHRAEGQVAVGTLSINVLLQAEACVHQVTRRYTSLTLCLLTDTTHQKSTQLLHFPTQPGLFHYKTSRKRTAMVGIK